MKCWLEEEESPFYKNGTAAEALDDCKATRITTIADDEWLELECGGGGMKAGAGGFWEDGARPNQNPSRHPDVKDSQIARWACDHEPRMGRNDFFEMGGTSPMGDILSFDNVAP